MADNIVFKQDLFRYVFPSGVPRDSFIVVSGEGGSGKSVILAHIVKDVLAYGEPVIYIALDDDPDTVLSSLKSFRVDVDSVCSERLLQVIDGFSYLLIAKKPYMHKCVVETITPEKPENLVLALIKVADSIGLVKKGAIIIDSLNESMITLDPSRFVFLVKSIRANLSKARGILTVASLHTSTQSLRDYLFLVEHIVDGIIETQSLPPEVSQHIPIFVRGLIVRKMKRTPYKQGVVLFGIDEEGIKPVMIRTTS